ncbi:MAG: response regulator [Cellulosilyticum sp.]|nr:response regulator [Cellulosilyticum sp.]
MYYVQIVDDEPIIRKGLSKMIDWNALGFEITSLAQNGKQALEQLEIEKVDVIITDIEMPIMNGLKFISEVRESERENNCLAKEIIVLTAYDEFEYAKEAIRHGVLEYVLKPIDEEEITQIMLKTKARLDLKHT